MRLLIGLGVVGLGLSGVLLAQPAGLSWQTVRTEALIHNRQIRAERAGVTASSKAVDAINAQRRVQGMFQTAWTATRKGVRASDGRLFDWKTDSDASQLNANIALSQLVWDGGKLDAQFDVSSGNRLISEMALDQTLISVRHTLRIQFLYLWAAQTLLNQNQIIKSRRDAQLKQIAYKYKAGLENMGALAIAKANLSDANFQVMDTARTVERNRIELAQNVGATLPLGPVVLTPESEAISLTGVDRYTDAHPMLALAKARVVQSRAQLAYQRALFAPDVKVNLQADKSVVNPMQHDPIATDRWDVSLVGTWQFWDGGQRQYWIEQSESQLNQAEISYDDVRAQVRTRLLSSYSYYQSRLANLDNAKAFLSAIEERAKIMTKQYESGLISFNDWSLIEDRRIGAEKSVIQAQLELNIAIADWVLARGGKLSDKI